MISTLSRKLTSRAPRVVAVVLCIAAFGCASSDDLQESLPQATLLATETDTPEHGALDSPSVSRDPTLGSGDCIPSSRLSARSNPIVRLSGSYKTSTRALLSELGDFSRSHYDVTVADHSINHVDWKITTEDSVGIMEVGRIFANTMDAAQWRVKSAEWCRIDSSTAGRAQRQQLEMREPIPVPDDFTECPLYSVGEASRAEGAPGFDVPGGVLANGLTPLPVADYSVDVVLEESHLMRWVITMPDSPWGLTFTRIDAQRTSKGWFTTADETCLMEPEAVEAWHAERRSTASTQ